MKLEEINILEGDPLPPFTTKRIYEALRSNKEFKTFLHRPQKKTQLRTLAIDEKLILEYWTNKPDFKFRTYIPASLHSELVLWYHLHLLHPNATRMINTIAWYFAWPKINATIRAEVINCPDCQQYKITPSRWYVHLTRNNHNCTIPWTDIHIDNDNNNNVNDNKQ